MKFLVSFLAIAVLCVTFASEAEAGRKKKRKGRGAHCGSVPAALYGGPAAQKRHNRAANADNLTRLDHRDDLERFIAQGHLVKIADTDAYYLDTIGGHDASHADLYRHARPWAKQFLNRELGAIHAKFGHRSKITSLVRTDAYQGRICRSGNLAAICGGSWWEQSLHVTGAAVDISKEGMSCKTLTAVRKRLVQLSGQGLIGAIEERGAFHVFVRKAYGKAVQKAGKPHKAKKSRKAKKKKRKRGNRGRTR